MEAYSRRENLLFEGISEVSVEGEDYEDTASVLRTFLSTILKVDSPEANEFQRVHRLGRKRAKGPRIIITRFLRYSDRQKLESLADLFKMTKSVFTDILIFQNIYKNQGDVVKTVQSFAVICLFFKYRDCPELFFLLKNLKYVKHT